MGPGLMLRKAPTALPSARCLVDGQRTYLNRAPLTPALGLSCPSSRAAGHRNYRLTVGVTQGPTSLRNLHEWRTRRAAWLLVLGRFPQLKTEVVEHITRCALAALDGAVEVALTERGGVFTGKVDAILSY